MPLVEVTDLGVSFGAQQALGGVSFKMMPGARFGVIGESGSGKTLTALAIAGLLPDGAQRTGEIRFMRQPIPTDDAAMARLRGGSIGMVFQEPMTALNPLMRVGEQIGEAVRLHLPKEDAALKVQALVYEVGLHPQHISRYPHQLSGGQRQRVMIAIALSGEPELLICDEPTSALDLITQRRILTLLDSVCARRNMALMFISHDLRAVAYLCDRVTVMHKGVQIESGPSAQIFAQPAHAYTQELIAASTTEVRPGHELISGAPLLAVKGVTRQFKRGGVWPFGEKSPLIAVDTVSLEVGAGEAVALVGPSGCGKTTLARMIAGLDQPDAGTLVLEGQSYGHDHKMPTALRREISLVFQDPFGSFDPRQSVGDAVAEPLRLLPGLDAEARFARIVSTLAAVGMHEDVLHRYPHAFSGGQRQRLAIARALVTRPKLVILDEPVSALDVSLRGDVLALLNHLRASFGLAYLLISHDLDMVRAVADRVLVMEAGRIVEEAVPERLFHHPQHQLTQDLLAARLPDLVASDS